VSSELKITIKYEIKFGESPRKLSRKFVIFFA